MELKIHQGGVLQTRLTDTKKNRRIQRFCQMGDFFDVRNPMENEGSGIKNMIIYHEHEKKRQGGQKEASLTI